MDENLTPNKSQNNNQPNHNQTNTGNQPGITSPEIPNKIQTADLTQEQNISPNNQNSGQNNGQNTTTIAGIKVVRHQSFKTVDDKDFAKEIENNLAHNLAGNLESQEPKMETNNPDLTQQTSQNFASSNSNSNSNSSSNSTSGPVFDPKKFQPDLNFDTKSPNSTASQTPNKIPNQDQKLSNNSDYSSPNPQSKFTNKQSNFQNISSNSAQNSAQKSPVKISKGFSIGKFISAFLIITCLSLIGLGTYFGYQIINASEGVLVRDDGCRGILCSLPNPLAAFNPTQNVQVAGQSSGRTNFLVVGTDSAAGLADTIILLSYYYKEGKIVSVNIPRDFYVQDTYGRNKINEVYPNAQRALKTPGAGAKHLAELLSKEFKIDIHYWAVTNFEGVEELITQLGGIEVDVPNGFTDCNYPTRNYSGYIRPCPTFKAGKQTMTGEQALIYARSRKGSNGEGSDFARSRRQQIIIQAAVQKAISLNLIDNVNNIGTYLNLASKSGQSNFTDIGQIYSLYNQVKGIDLGSAFFRINWNDNNGFLCPGPEPEIEYYITYCGGQVAGSNGSAPSAARQKAIDSIQNMLKFAEAENLYGVDVKLYGNGSKAINTLTQDLKNENYTDITSNNKANTLPKITTGETQEKAVIVIKDPQTLALFKKYPPITTVPYTVVSTTTDASLQGVVLPKNADKTDVSADILVIVLPA